MSRRQVALPVDCIWSYICRVPARRFARPGIGALPAPVVKFAVLTAWPRITVGGDERMREETWHELLSPASAENPPVFPPHGSRLRRIITGPVCGHFLPLGGWAIVAPSDDIRQTGRGRVPPVCKAIDDHQPETKAVAG